VILNVTKCLCVRSFSDAVSSSDYFTDLPVDRMINGLTRSQGRELSSLICGIILEFAFR
jgi:hypothetical protein